MVILQQELVKIRSGQEPSALIYPLLSAVKQGCTKADLVRAMSIAKSDVEKLDMDRQKEIEKKDSEEEELIVKEVPDEIKTGIFLKEMAAAGFSLTLAEEALKHVNPDDIDGGDYKLNSHARRIFKTIGLGVGVYHPHFQQLFRCIVVCTYKPTGGGAG